MPIVRRPETVSVDVTVTRDVDQLVVSLSVVQERRPAVTYTPAEAAEDVVRWFHGLNAAQVDEVKHLETRAHDQWVYRVTFTRTVDEYTL